MNFHLLMQIGELLIDFLAANHRVSPTNLVEGNIPQIIILPVLLVSHVTGDGLVWM